MGSRALSAGRTAGTAVFAAAVAAIALGGAGRVSADLRTPAMVPIPAGSYLPLYGAPAPADGTSQGPVRRRVPVRAFTMARYAVTNGEYLEFVRAHPAWRRSQVKPVFADAAYLRHWRSDLEPGDRAPANSPVVNVSWFAARAYLKTRGQRLPTVHEWEYAASASETRRDASRDRAFLDQLRRWYGRPTPPVLPAVGSAFRNVYGVYDLHGLVWEWTLDFNAALVTGESRGDGSLERSLFCGSGVLGAADFEDYAAFMRYAFRSSLEARYGVANLGFRGVLDTGESRR
jgi:formylglycine-generating enzyme required for sulfatase activity